MYVLGGRASRVKLRPAARRKKEAFLMRRDLARIRVKERASGSEQRKVFNKLLAAGKQTAEPNLRLESSTA